MAGETSKGVVLLTEDDSDLREIISSFLEAKGWSVLAVPNRVEVFDHARRERPRVAVIDVRSFGSIAFKILARLREDQPPMPIIVIASFGDAFVATRAKVMGVACVLEKPFDLEDLERAVHDATIMSDP